MNTRPVIHLVAIMLMAIGFAIGLCALVSHWFDDPYSARSALTTSFLGIELVAAIAWASTRHCREFSIRDGIGTVTFGWMAASVAGAMPFLLSGTAPTFVDALFETVSGFTTTGSSIMPDPDTLPKGILLWRAFTHFFGGMGILLFCIALLPLVGAGGTQIYRAESSSASFERLTPRIANTGKLLWGIYILLNGACAVLLLLGGMNWFDAVCHAFAAIATGGFSTKTLSIAAYNSVYIEGVLIFFMLAGATNFTLHFHALRGEPLKYFRDAEFRFYLGFWALLSLAIAFSTTWAHYGGHFLHALRASMFTVASLVTTTGFTTDDFDLWPAFAKCLLLLAMVAGGCAGSTTGGLKQIRLLVTLKRIGREMMLYFHPNAIIQIRINKRPLESNAVSSITVFTTMYLITLGGITILMTLFTDFETALSSTIASVGNVGPGFHLAGALESYATFPAPAKAILTLGMLLGRLEFYSFFVIFLPRFWKK